MSQSMEERARAWFEEHEDCHGSVSSDPRLDGVSALASLLREVRRETLEEAANTVYSMGAADRIRSLISSEEVRRG